MNPLARSAIRALRSCIEPTTSSDVRPGWAISERTQRVGEHADHLSPAGERGVGDDPHQADVTAAVDETEISVGETRPSSAACSTNAGCDPTFDPQNTPTRTATDQHWQLTGSARSEPAGARLYRSPDMS